MSARALPCLALLLTACGGASSPGGGSSPGGEPLPRFGTDCYPQSGSISVTVTKEGLPPITAEVAFEDDGLGLDSDDSGLVHVAIDGVEHTAKVPARSCEG